MINGDSNADGIHFRSALTKVTIFERISEVPLTRTYVTADGIALMPLNAKLAGNVLTLNQEIMTARKMLPSTLRRHGNASNRSSVEPDFSAGDHEISLTENDANDVRSLEANPRRPANV